MESASRETASRVPSPRRVSQRHVPANHLDSATAGQRPADADHHRVCTRCRPTHRRARHCRGPLSTEYPPPPSRWRSSSCCCPMGMCRRAAAHRAGLAQRPARCVPGPRRVCWAAVRRKRTVRVHVPRCWRATRATKRTGDHRPGHEVGRSRGRPATREPWVLHRGADELAPERAPLSLNAGDRRTAARTSRRERMASQLPTRAGTCLPARA